MKDNCPFCHLGAERELVLENNHCFCIYDNFPVSTGHCLVIPKRHTNHYFELSQEEKIALWNLIDEVRDYLQNILYPNGFNIGFNVGKAAGQTVFHTHIHVIPRFDRDCSDPTGGIRNIFPTKAKYE